MGGSIGITPVRIIEICEDKWEANKADCSGFVKAVTAQCGIFLHGQANDIVRQLRASWNKAADGPVAASKAAESNLVIGGLEASPNGHVVVVVQGPLNRGKYPTAYWGKLHGVGRKNTTINWAWDELDRDKVEYYYVLPGNKAVASATPMRIIGWSANNAKTDGIS